MKRALEGQLRVLEDALTIAYRRTRAAANAAEHEDDELCQHLLNISSTIGGIREDISQTIIEVEDARNLAAAPNDYTKGGE